MKTIMGKMKKGFILLILTLGAILCCGFSAEEPTDLRYTKGMISVGNYSGEEGVVTDDPDSLMYLQKIVDAISDIPCVEFGYNPDGGLAADLRLERLDGRIDRISYRSAGDAAEINGVYYKTTKENFILALRAVDKVKLNKNLVYYAQYKQPKETSDIILISSGFCDKAEEFLKMYRDAETYPRDELSYYNPDLETSDQIILYLHNGERPSSYTVTPILAFSSRFGDDQEKSFSRQKYEELREILGANQLQLPAAERLTVMDDNGKEAAYLNPEKIEEILEPLRGIKESPMQNMAFCSDGSYTLCIDGEARYTVYDSPGLWVYSYGSQTVYYSPDRQYSEWLDTLE